MRIGVNSVLARTARGSDLIAVRRERIVFREGPMHRSRFVRGLSFLLLTASAGFALGLLVLFSLLVPASPMILERTVDAPDASRILYGLYNLEANEETTFRWSPDSWGVARVTAITVTAMRVTAMPPNSMPRGATTPTVRPRANAGS